LLAVDEAHCISEWGQAFRPDYLRLSHFAQAISAQRVLALTATATASVADDMKVGFGIADADCVRTSFHRPNLKLGCQVVSAEERDAALLRRLLDPAKPRGSTVVYVTTQHTTEQVAKQLVAAGLPAHAYHAGMHQEKRTLVQEGFMASADGIIVATIAFGMGIDKANIRHVVHYNMPKSLESYAQEIGRAGRDGLPSWCDMLFCADDMPVLESFARCDTLEEHTVADMLRDIFHCEDGAPYRHGVVREIKLDEMAKAHDVSQMTVRMLLAFVDIYHGHLETLTPQYNSYQIAPTSQSAGAHTVPVSIRAARSLNAAAAEALATHLVCKKKWAYIDLAAAARYSGVSRAELSVALAALESNSRLQVKASGVVHCYKIASQPAALAALAAAEFTRFKERERRELARISQVIAFVTADCCQAQLLMRHFGEDPGAVFPRPADEAGPSSGGPLSSCGNGCERCRSGKALAVPKLGGACVDTQLWQKLASDAALPRDSPRLLARFAFGFTSPRITALKLKGHPLFGCLTG
jgi:ATP-dependent DNA helicase RecQ